MQEVTHHSQKALYWLIYQGLSASVCALLIQVTVSHAAAPLPIFSEGFDQLLSLPIEELVTRDVTVASRYEQRLSDAPATITVIGREQIDQMGLDTLWELMAHVPGIQIDFDSKTANRIPTYNIRGQYHAQVLILIDGKPLNDHVNPKPMVFARNLPLYNLERVEVLRGPGSSIYGNSASVAIINLVTRQEMNEARLEVGEHGAHKASLGVSGQWQDAMWTFFLQHEGDNGQSYTDIFDHYGLSDSTEDPTRNFNLQLSGRYKRLVASLYHTRTRQDNFYLFGDLGNDINYDKSSTTLFNLGYELPLKENMTASFDLGYRYYKDDALSLGGVFTPAPNLVIGPSFTHQILRLSTHLVWDFSNNQTLSAGIDYENAEIPNAFIFSNYDLRTDPPSYLGTPTVLVDPNFRFISDITRTNRAVYLQDEIRGRNWLLTLGGRYDDYSDTSSRFSPKFSASYWLDTNNLVKFNYGEAFQAPVMSRMYNANNPQTLGNLNLKPSVVTTYDLSFNRYTDGYAASINLYHSRTKEIVMGVPTGLPGQIRFENVGEQSTIGAELALTLPISKKTLLKFNYSHILNNEFTSDTSLNTLPPTAYVASSTASFDLNHQVGQWNLNLNGTWYNDIEALPEQDHVGLLNTKIQYRITPKLSTYLKVNNLLDTDWDSVTPGTGLGTLNGEVVRAAPNRGRWIYLGLNYLF